MASLGPVAQQGSALGKVHILLKYKRALMFQIAELPM
jgi:hypothetical protein